MGDTGLAFCGADHAVAPALTCPECRDLLGLEPAAPLPVPALRHYALRGRPAGPCGVGVGDVKLVQGWALRMTETTCLACLDALGVLDEVLGEPT